MTISLERLLRHMAWANQRTIEHLQTLPEDSLKSFATNPEWKVAEILRHIVESANFYAFRITGNFPANADKSEAQPTRDDLESLREKARAVDQALLECEKLEDVEVEFVRNDGEKVKRWRSTILSQAIHHATEHRAQIASALEAKGFAPVDLDELDLWSYEIAKG